MRAPSADAPPQRSSSSLPADARSAKAESVRTVHRRASGRKARPGSPPTGPRPLRAKVYQADGEQPGASTLWRRQIDLLDAPERVDMAEVEAMAGASDLIEMVSDIRVLNAALSRLTPREERIIRLRFGLGSDGEWTLREVGEAFGVTREQIRRIEMKAIRKLRYHFRQAYGPLPCDPSPHPVAPLPAAPCAPPKLNPVGKASVRVMSADTVTAAPRSTITQTRRIIVPPAPQSVRTERENGILGAILSLFVGLALIATAFDQTLLFHMSRHIGPVLGIVAGAVVLGIGLFTLVEGGKGLCEGDVIRRGRAGQVRLFFLGASLGFDFWRFRSPDFYRFLLHLSAETPSQLRGDMPLKVSMFMGLFLIIGAMRWSGLLLHPEWLETSS